VNKCYKLIDRPKVTPANGIRDILAHRRSHDALVINIYDNIDRRSVPFNIDNSCWLCDWHHVDNLSDTIWKL